MSSTFAQLDSRKRLNLAPFARSDVYLITTEPNGRITLEPARVVSELDQALAANPAIVAALDRHNTGTGNYVDE